MVVKVVVVVGGGCLENASREWLNSRPIQFKLGG